MRRRVKSRATFDGPNYDTAIPWGTSSQGFIWGETRDRRRYFITPARCRTLEILLKSEVTNIQKAIIGQYGAVHWEGEKPFQPGYSDDSPSMMAGSPRY